MGCFGSKGAPPAADSRDVSVAVQRDEARKKRGPPKIEQLQLYVRRCVLAQLQSPRRLLAALGRLEPLLAVRRWLGHRLQ